VNKILIALAFGVGYVLGSRAGRKRYEQIRDKAQQVWNDDRVQDAVHKAADGVEKAASTVASKAGDAIKSARS
jgi:hypothetical protein